jgi:RNA polymerase sigma-70 factor (ECF subfamily)
MKHLEPPTVSNTAEFSLAYSDFEQGLIRYSFFKTHNLQISEDLVQDTFMKTWNYLVRGGHIHLIKAFLYHTLHCLIIDEYRKKRMSSLDELVECGFEPANTDHEEMITQLDGKSAMGTINTLPEKYRKIMRMRYELDLSLAEISEKTGIARNTISVQVFRALQLLRNQQAH